MNYVNIEMKKKLIFIHIPKCGGQSVLYGIHQIFGSNKILKIWNPKFGATVSIDGFQNMEIEKIKKYDCIAGHIPYNIIRDKLGEDLIKQYFICSTLRDPVDRIVSAYNYISSSHHPNGDDVQNMKFSQFIDSKYAFNEQCNYICEKTDADSALRVIESEYALVYPIYRIDELIQILTQKFIQDSRTIISDVKNKSPKKLISRKDLSPQEILTILNKTKEDLILFNAIKNM